MIFMFIEIHRSLKNCIPFK